MQRIDPAVAVVGLGRMGRGIARALDAAGLLCAVYDTDAAAVRDAGLSDTVAVVCGQALVDRAGIVLFAVPATQDIAQALDGCRASGPTLVVDLTTSDPSGAVTFAADLAGRGFGYVDAAMTGGAAGADAGTLTLMVGGTQEAVATCAPVFDVMAGKVFHLGPVGAGQTMKLVHNLILHAGFMATCEGLRLAERAGLDTAEAVDVLNAGNARSFVTEVRFPRDILSSTMDARSQVGTLAKDLELAVAFAQTQGAVTPYGTLTRDLLAASVGMGDGGTDFSHLFPEFDRIVAAREGET